MFLFQCVPQQVISKHVYGPASPPIVSVGFHVNWIGFESPGRPSGRLVCGGVCRED